MESYFGEYGLITGKTRSLSAKSRDFTEVYVIKKINFDQAAENYMEAIRCLK
jgi:CRP-like cAMP-binding protein